MVQILVCAAVRPLPTCTCRSVGMAYFRIISRLPLCEAGYSSPVESGCASVITAAPEVKKNGGREGSPRWPPFAGPAENVRFRTRCCNTRAENKMSAIDARIAKDSLSKGKAPCIGPASEGSLFGHFHFQDLINAVLKTRIHASASHENHSVSSCDIATVTGSDA